MFVIVRVSFLNIFLLGFLLRRSIVRSDDIIGFIVEMGVVIGELMFEMEYIKRYWLRISLSIVVLFIVRNFLMVMFLIFLQYFGRRIEMLIVVNIILMLVSWSMGILEFRQFSRVIVIFQDIGVNRVYIKLSLLICFFFFVFLIIIMVVIISRVLIIIWGLIFLFKKRIVYSIVQSGYVEVIGIVFDIFFKVEKQK